MLNDIDKKINLFFNLKKFENATPMCKIFNNNFSDKANHHNYTTLYSHIFENLKFQKLNIFEVGLGTNDTTIPSNMGPNGVPGASLRSWKEFFVNSMIYGADIDKACLFQEDRIKTFFVDQTNKEIIKRLWNEICNTEFDMIIDDGLHEYHANRILFENSIHKLKRGGIYIIEDIRMHEYDLFDKWFMELEKQSKFAYLKICIIPGRDISDNIIAIIVK